MSYLTIYVPKLSHNYERRALMPLALVELAHFSFQRVKTYLLAALPISLALVLINENSSGVLSSTRSRPCQIPACQADRA